MNSENRRVRATDFQDGILFVFFRWNDFVTIVVIMFIVIITVFITIITMIVVIFLKIMLSNVNWCVFRKWMVRYIDGIQEI